MAQEQRTPQTEPWSNASAPEGDDASATGDKNCWSPPWLSWNTDTFTNGMKAAFDAWSTFVSEQCKVASSYDPKAGSLGEQASDAWRKYADGVADLSSKLLNIAGEVYCLKSWLSDEKSQTPTDSDAE